jgi:hypothetical protein
MQRTPRTVNCEHDCEGDLPRIAKRRQERHSRGENRTVHYLRALTLPLQYRIQLLNSCRLVAAGNLGRDCGFVFANTCARAERCAVKRPKLHGCVSNVKVSGFGK